MRKINGYSAFELILALIMVSMILYFSVNYGHKLIEQTTGESVSQEAYDYAEEMIRYINTHQSLLREVLSQNGASNGKMVTVPAQVLKNEGFIKDNYYFKNKLNQYPCTIIWYDNHQLQSLIYYRDDNNAKTLDNYQWIYGLNHIGAMIGFYAKGQVLGVAKDWALDTNFIHQMFVSEGSADISQANNPDLYRCPGTQISEPSYVVNLTSLLDVTQSLPKDDTIHQYPDIFNDIDDPENNNRMNVDVNLDSLDNFNIRRQNNVVFQMNPNCVMDPGKPATMQDYDFRNPATDYSLKVNSTLGCRNRQLAIQVTNSQIDNSPEMVVTGFNQGGNPKAWGSDRQYVGEVSAASLQPTTQIAVGSSCQPKEVGTMAQQQKSSDSQDINNIYVSQVICMKSLLCDQSNFGYCYLPVQNVTIQYKPNTASFSCPNGTFIDKASVQINQINLLNQVTCHSTGGDCSAQNVARGSTIYDPDGAVSRSLIITQTQWYQGCPFMHSGCNEGWGNIANTQDTITQINCTNDPSKAPIVINR